MTRPGRGGRRQTSSLRGRTSGPARAAAAARRDGGRRSRRQGYQPARTTSFHPPNTRGLPCRRCACCSARSHLRPRSSIRGAALGRWRRSTRARPAGRSPRSHRTAASSHGSPPKPRRAATRRGSGSSEAPVSLAVAGNGGSPALLWTLHESAARAVRFDYVLGATVSDPRERRFQEVAHASHGAGLWLGGVAGSGETLVYAVAEVAYKDQVACLSTPTEPGACELKVAPGGGIYRIVGRKPPTRIKGAPAAVAVAASGNDVAYVPAIGASTVDGHPLASRNVPVEVRDVNTGSLVLSVS